jgi:hypothetical protein
MICLLISLYIQDKNNSVHDGVNFTSSISWRIEHRLIRRFLGSPKNEQKSLRQPKDRPAR